MAGVRIDSLAVGLTAMTQLSIEARRLESVMELHHSILKRCV